MADHETHLGGECCAQFVGVDQSCNGGGGDGEIEIWLSAFYASLDQVGPFSTVLLSVGCVLFCVVRIADRLAKQP